MSIKQTFQNVSDFVKVANEVVPHLKNMVKSMGDEKLKEALSTEENMKVFAENLYAKMPSHVKMKCSYDVFLNVIIANRTKMMKKKSNQKKVFGKALPKEKSSGDDEE